MALLREFAHFACSPKACPPTGMNAGFPIRTPSRTDFASQQITAQKADFGRVFLAMNCRALKRARLQRFATVCDKLRHFSGVTATCNTLQRSATARQPGLMRIGSKDPVVEHKGSVERGGVFSLATSARSVVSAVGQTAPVVRPMFDAGVQGQKKPGIAEMRCSRTVPNG